jgi:hypothetical protein
LGLRRKFHQAQVSSSPSFIKPKFHQALAPTVSSLRSYAEVSMCRSIRPLFNFEPPATDEEIRAAAIQFVRKVSGYTHPSKANQTAFDCAVDDVAAAAMRLLAALQTTGPARDRAIEAAKARDKARKRNPFSPQGARSGEKVA